MIETTEFTLTGHVGGVYVRRWRADAGPPRYSVLLVHGYGQHVGWYEHVAEHLVADGAVVYGMDHAGHGRSAGERALVEDATGLLDDLHLVHELVSAQHPDVPVTLVGHSMGGLLGARYAQLHGGSLAAVVLSSPALGRWAVLDALMASSELAQAPIDPAILSRDPAVGEAYQSDPLIWRGPFRRPTLEAMQQLMASVHEAGALSGCPVLWLHGADDQLVPYEGTASGWQRYGVHGEAKAYPQARHEIFKEINKDEVLNDVTSFLRRHVG